MFLEILVLRKGIAKSKSFLAQEWHQKIVVINYVVKIKSPHEESYPFFHLVLSALSYCHPRENGDSFFSYFLDSRLRGNDTREMIACPLRINPWKANDLFLEKKTLLLVIKESLKNEMRKNHDRSTSQETEPYPPKPYASCRKLRTFCEP